MEGYFSQGARHSRLLSEQVAPIVPEKITWQVLKAPERLSKKFTFQTTEARNFFLSEILEYEAVSHHHAKIQIDELAVIINVFTKNMNAVTELDFEYKKQADLIYNDSKTYEDARDDLGL